MFELASWTDSVVQQAHTIPSSKVWDSELGYKKYHTTASRRRLHERKIAKRSSNLNLRWIELESCIVCAKSLFLNPCLNNRGLRRDLHSTLQTTTSSRFKSQDSISIFEYWLCHCDTRRRCKEVHVMFKRLPSQKRGPCLSPSWILYRITIYFFC